jgi:hypothetical protein
VTTSYGHNGLNRLTGFSNTLGVRASYSSDLAGNRTDDWWMDNAANQVVGWSYDAVGNLLSDGSTSSTWDALGRLVTQGTTTNAYNGDGVLVQRGTTRYTQDLAAPLSQVLAADGASVPSGRWKQSSGWTRSMGTCRLALPTARISSNHSIVTPIRGWRSITTKTGS